MEETVEVRRVDIEIVIPVDDCRRASTVLAAAISLFGPDDPVRIVLTPDDETEPTVQHAQALSALLNELQHQDGPLPHMSLTAAADRQSPAVSVRASGQSVHDARAILVLASFGARLSDSFGRGCLSAAQPRGGFAVARAEAVAKRLRRDLAGARAEATPIRIAVYLWNPGFWPVVETVVGAAIDNEQVEIEVVCPQTDASGHRRGPVAGETSEFFARFGIEPRDDRWLRANLADLDVVIMPDPYDIPRPAGLRAGNLAEAGIRLVYLPYAQALSADTDNVRMLYNLPLQNIAWRTYVANDSQLENYQAYCDAGAGHVRSLGSVKNERLLTSERGQAKAQQIRDLLGTETIALWNPHWSIGNDGWSTFAQNMVPIMQYFMANSTRGLILRPHPRLLLELDRHGSAAQLQVTEFRAMCETLANVYLDEDYDHAPALLAADMMISDLSSVIPEYLCLNRPTGYLSSPGGAQLNCDRSWLDNVTQISTEQDLVAFLDQAISPEPRQIQAPDLGAGRRVVTSIVSDFLGEIANDHIVVQIDPPAAEPGQAATVLAAAVAQFGPQDPVRFSITFEESVSGLLIELQTEFGSLPQLTSETAGAGVSLPASGYPVADAQAILALNSLHHHLGTCRSGTTRGGFWLARADMRGGLKKRDVYRPRSVTDRIRIAVFLWSPQYWSVVETFVQAARSHAEVTVDVVCPEFDPGGDRGYVAGETARFFTKRGVHRRDERWLRAHLDELDIVVTADPYDERRPVELRATAFVEAGIRVVYLPYAQALSAHPANLTMLYNELMHNIAWRIYVASERQLNNYATYCETGNEHVRCLGSIKNERFFTSKSGAQAAARIRSALGTTSTVLWNPHWSFGTGGWSTFVQNIAPIMRFFGEHRDRGLILRPHPNLLANLIAHSDRGTTLVADLRAMCRDLPNVYLDEDYDHLPAMLAADCLISDLSSIIPEYLGLNRPIGYLRLTGSDLEVNADSGWRDAAIDIDTEEALLAFLENPVTRAHQTNDRHDIGSGARIVTDLVVEFRADACHRSARAVA